MIQYIYRKRPLQWDQALVHAEFAYNNSVQNATGVALFYSLFPNISPSSRPCLVSGGTPCASDSEANDVTNAGSQVMW